MNVTLATRLLRLQQSLHGGGSQHGSNLNVHLEYIWVKKMTGGKAKDPLAKQNFTAKHDRNIYNKWYQYNEQNFCCSSTELQPDLQVSAGAMPTLYGEVSSIQGRLNIPAINRINILAAHILCYNKHAITFYAEENAFSILFYGWDDGNGRIFLETLNMDHSPRIEAEDDDDDDSDEDDDDKPSKRNLEKGIYGTQPTCKNQSPLPDDLNGVLEEMVKCVLVMEAWCRQMLQAFDNDGDQYSTQHHNHTKHDFPVMPDDDMWLVDADGKPIVANPDHIYKFTNMK